ncbi:flavodoxin family protein [Collinsella sp. zg1085]|uniref:flavodoxin family protein n=1 Tax=Collinsella sp. zg1085 TaxID=2844380 RepID=UPI001C0C0A69|nr:flavodoxin family protein [Collinsella sp. zg1085]QWT17681.1 flavodoxin family protein [Collinsella sp. zg1085]
MTKIVGVSFGTKNGNNDAFCKEALIAAQEAGCEVEFIRAQDLTIKHCTGCITCVKMLMSGRGNMCIHKDDFDWLAMEMFRADGVLMVDPIFEKGASGLFHTIMDRFGPRMDTGNNYICADIAQKNIAEGKPGKMPDPAIMSPKVVSYIAIGGSDWGTHVESDHQIQAMTPSWKVIDNEWFSWAKTALMEDEMVARAHQIGVNLAEAAKDIEHAEYKGDEGICPHCHAKDFYIKPGTARAICTVCGLEGELSIVDGAAKVTYSDDEWHKAHDIASGKQIHGMDIAQNEGRLAELKKTDAYKERIKYYKEAIQPTQPEQVA